MRVCRKCLAIGTKIGIVTDGTLVTITTDVISFILAKRSITSNVMMCYKPTGWASNMFVDWNKTMARVNVTSTLNAGSAVIPIRAVQALVTNPMNVLIGVNDECSDERMNLIPCHIHRRSLGGVSSGRVRKAEHPWSPC